MTTQDGSVTPRLVAAIDGAWSAIRARHPDVPEVVITLGAGSGGRRGLTYGHFHDGIWQHGDARLPELFIGGEGLQRGPVPVLGTLLHESAHGIAARRGIRDTSRQSRYHNERFRALAAEVGIDVEKDPAIGWSTTTVPDATAALYRPHVDALGTALTAFRRPVTAGAGAGRAGSDNGIAARCPCGRRIRVSQSVLAAAPITCGACGGDFAG
jgi:hypothetical protein